MTLHHCIEFRRSAEKELGKLDGRARARVLRAIGDHRVVDPSELTSRSRNTPYAGRTLTGRVRHTVLHGEPVVIDAEAQR